MKSKYISRCDGNKRLLVIFAGWGMDWRPFADLSHPDYDILVVWDYRELSFNGSPLLRYDEICVLAWSMGVFAASVTIHEIEPRITTRIAVNGTLQPIDDVQGIPPAIWDGTLNALSPSTWRKFQRRMCDSAQQFNSFSEKAPHRTISELKEELEALRTHTIFHAEQVTEWDMAIVGRHDAIFPAVNQMRAWKGVAPVRVMESGHLPDFAQLVSRLFKDKGKVARHFTKARSTYGGEAVMQQAIARSLMARFNAIFGKGPIVGNVIEAGCGVDGILTRSWIDRTDPRAKLLLWDIADVTVDVSAPNMTFERCDAEVRMKRQPSGSARFIFSSSTVQWFNSPRDFLKECARVLVPGGYMVISSFTQNNFKEIRSVTGNGLQLPTVKDWRGMVPLGMEVLECVEEERRLSFESPRRVLEHLRDTGVNGVRYGTPAHTLARRLLNDYPADEESGNYTLTYAPVYIIARKCEET